MSKFVSSCLYFTSFLPLWISILFIDIKSCLENRECLQIEKLSIFIIFLANIISIVVVCLVLFRNSKEGSTRYVIINATEDKTITSEYLLSYILPLFAFDFTKWDQVILFLIFFLTLGFLCIRHNHFSVNIWLEILNFKIFICELEGEDQFIIQKKVISHRTLNAQKGEFIYLKSLNNEIKLEVGN